MFVLCLFAEHVTLLLVVSLLTGVGTYDVAEKKKKPGFKITGIRTYENGLVDLGAGSSNTNPFHYEAVVFNKTDSAKTNRNRKCFLFHFVTSSHPCLFSYPIKTRPALLL